MRQFGAAVLLAALAGCSLTPEKEDPVQVKLNDLDARVTRIERVVSNQSLVDLAQRLDAAQADVRALRGRLEELENGTESLRKQQRDLYADLDKRISGLNSGSSGSAAPLVPGAPGTPPAGSTRGGGSGTSAAEQAAYSQAFDALKLSNYPGAISGFRQFLASFPTSDLADNAQYWLGEAYYVTRDFDQAATSFRVVGERWPNSRKAPDALVKLGFAQYELKRYPEARATLSEVTRRFPDSDAARLAAERLRRLPADAH
jgi:tol-pal system protein YbgF